jgi:hypothetical protein
MCIGSIFREGPGVNPKIVAWLSKSTFIAQFPEKTLEGLGGEGGRGGVKGLAYQQVVQECADFSKLEILTRIEAIKQLFAPPRRPHVFNL